MGDTAEQLFFIDTTAKQESKTLNFDGEEGPNSISTERWNQEKESGVEVALNILGEDEEERELERLVFGVEPEKIFEEEDQDESQLKNTIALNDEDDKEDDETSSSSFMVNFPY